MIADSLGGVSNAYNITPQESTLNRHGDQAYMEDQIRKSLQAGLKVTDFEANITYPNNETQIPSHYKFTYKIDGREVIDEFDNINPDDANAEINNSTEESTTDSTNGSADSSTTNSTTGLTEADIAKIDTNGNGTVTIAEAEAAGFTMPIYSTHWLYKYMRDGDGDGMVGE